MKNITMFKENKQHISYIIANPLKQQSFTFREYNNWNSISPTFTKKDYIIYIYNVNNICHPNKI